MYKQTISGILRLDDNAAIPIDENNIDYMSYLEWLAQGNTPEPMDAAPVVDVKQIQEDAAAIEMVQADTTIQAIVTTPPLDLYQQVKAMSFEELREFVAKSSMLQSATARRAI